MKYHQLLDEKVCAPEAALKKLKSFRDGGKTIVFTNGCFDILHAGHVDYLSQARDLGDCLVVGLNTDASVRRLEKAPGRPVNPQNARACVLAALGCVDVVVFFDESTPLDLITLVQPDVLVKGGDYTIDTIVGADLVSKRGGRVVTIPLLPGYSTTSIIQKLKG